MYNIIGADGKVYGPIGVEQVRQWVNEGRVNAQTKIQAEGTDEWKSITEFLELAPLMSTAPATAPPAFVAPAEVPKTNQMALTGLILGIISVTIGGCCCYGLPFNVLGIVFSCVGLSQINKDPQNQRGRGMAIAGLVLSILSFVLVGVLLMFGVAMNSTEILRKFKFR